MTHRTLGLPSPAIHLLYLQIISSFCTNYENYTQRSGVQDVKGYKMSWGYMR